MAGVTIHPPGDMQQGQPSQLAAPAAAPEARVTPGLSYCTDETGRQIGWRRLNALEDFDLTEIAGANSGNEEWMLRATVAYGVREIDGEPVSKPLSKAQLRALVARLDTPGMQAVLGLLQEQAVRASEAQDEKDRAKN